MYNYSLYYMLVLFLSFLKFCLSFDYDVDEDTVLCKIRLNKKCDVMSCIQENQNHFFATYLSCRQKHFSLPK